MAIGEKEEGYIDAFYGDARLKAEGQALAATSDLPALAARVSALRGRVSALGAEDPRRAAFLIAQLTAAATRLRMLGGEKLPFAAEAEGLFGVRPELKPLASYDPILARIESLVPGTGTLADRVEAYQNRFTIPRDKLEPVFRNAIAACRTATVEHIALPPSERFDLAFVTGKSWSGYNYYQGRLQKPDRGQHRPADPHQPRDRSGLSRRLSRPPCTERPARRAAGARQGLGRIQRLSPVLAPIAAGRGVGQLWHRARLPGRAQSPVRGGVLAPLAGLDAAEVGRYEQLGTLIQEFAGSRNTISQQLLDGQIDDAQAVA